MPLSPLADEGHGDSWSMNTIPNHSSPTIAQTQYPDTTDRNTSPASVTSPLSENVLSTIDIEFIPGPPYRCPYAKCKGKQYTLRSDFK